jgi:hypothetical protein
MRALLALAVCVGLALMAWCGWGLFTKSGQAAYPEMAGLIPFYAGIGGAACLILAAGAYGFRCWRRNRNNKSRGA